MRKLAWGLLTAIVFCTAPLLAQVSGSVFTQAGDPVRDVKVVAYAAETTAQAISRVIAGTSRAELATAMTGPDGAFALQTKRSGVVELAVSAKGFAPLSTFVAADEKEVVLELRAVPTATCRVTAKGKPVANALVVMLSREHGPQWSGRTDEHGSLQTPDPSRWADGIVVVHPDYAPLHETLDRRVPGPLTLDLRLESGDALSGNVVRSDGKAAPAQIFVDGWPAATSGDDGAFTIAHIAATVTRIDAIAGLELGSAARIKGVTIQTAAPREITGTVRDSAHQPLAGMPIWLWNDTDARIDSVTDAKGNYSAKGVAAQYEVSPRGPANLDFDPATADLRKRATLNLDFGAKPAASIRGTVVDEAKHPVAGALVGYTSTNSLLYGLVQNDTHSGPDGRFRLSKIEVDDASVRIAAMKPGYALTAVAPGKGSPETSLTLILSRGVELSGIVRDEAGKPVANATISAMQDPTGAMPLPIDLAVTYGGGAPWLMTNDNGEFKLQLNAGEHDISASKSGFVSSRMSVTVGPSIKPVELTLHPAVEIRGRVVHKGGSPVTHGIVSARGMASPDFAAARIGSDGTFVLTGLSPNDYTIAFGGPGSAPVKRTVKAPADNYVIELEPQRTVHGRVIDRATGQPVATANVVAKQNDDPVAFAAAVDAAFSIDVPLGSLELSVSADGYLDETIKLTDQAPTEVVASMTRGRTIHGRVTSASGTPLDNVSVQVGNSEVSLRPSEESTSDGEYELRGIAHESVSLRFSRDGYISTRQSVPAGKEDARVDVTLSAGRSVRGHVLAEDGTPVAGAGVMASSAARGADSQDATTDAEGAFKIDGLGAGRYSFTATKQGLGSAELNDVDIAGTPDILLKMKPSKSGTIRGVVRGFNGGQWFGGMVTASNGDDTAFAQLKRDGSFVLEGAPAGENVTVNARAMAMNTQASTRKVTVALAPSADINVELVLSDGVAIRGTVTRDGQPVAGAAVSFGSQDTFGDATAVTDSTGHYEVRLADDGTYSVSVSSQTPRSSSFMTTYEARGPATFDIALRFGRIEGRVVDEHGAAIEGAKIAAEPAGTGRGSVEANSDAAGAFALDVQADTSYTVTASKRGFVPATSAADTHGNAAAMTLTLRAGNTVKVRLTDARDGATLSGTVVVRDAADRVISRGGEEEADGAIALSLPPGSHRISASATGYATQTVRNSIMGGDVQIPLTPGGTLVVRTNIDSKDSVKLIAATGEEYVRCECNGIAEIHLSGVVTTIEHVAPGVYAVQVIAPDHKVKASVPASVQEGQTTIVAIQLAP